MAVSDNVLNAAFVPPSSRNTSTFLNALTYTARPPSHWSLPAQPYKLSRTGQTTAYDPPLEEFTVLWTKLSKSVPKDSTTAAKDASDTMTGIISKDDYLSFDEAGKSRGDADDNVQHVKEVLSGAAGPTIGIVTQGTVEFREEGKEFVGVTVGPGGVVFVKPGTEISVQAIDGEAEVWWASCVE